MPERSENKLKAVQVENTVMNLSDGGGLHLLVTSASKRWQFKFQWDGRGKELWLGAYPDVSLAQARELRNVARAKVRSGLNPITERRADKAGNGPSMSFAAFCRQEVDTLAPPKEKGRRQWLIYMTRSVGALADLPPAQITTEVVKAALLPFWVAQPPTSYEIRKNLVRVLNAARVAGLIPQREWINPAFYRGHLEHVMPKVKHRAEKRAALAWEELPAFMFELRSKVSGLRLGFEWCILTTVRHTEGFAARWCEIDLRRRIWTVPAERMKGQEGAVEAHEVPLTAAMLRVLKKARDWSGDTSPDAFIFPASRSKSGYYPPTATHSLRKRLCPDITTHGFRSTFAIWAEEETDHGERIIDRCLAHVPPNAKVKNRYLRSKLVEKRRAVMRDWCAYVDSPPPLAQIVQLSPRPTAARARFQRAA